LHDDEIASGADAVLVKHLTFLICHSKHMPTTPTPVQHNNNNMDTGSTSNAATAQTATVVSITELVMTLESLEALYRASSSMVGLSFQRMGPELLYLLTLIVDEEVDRRVEKLVQQQQHENRNNTMDDVQQQQQQQPQAQQLPLQHAQPKQSSWITLQNVLGQHVPGSDQQQQGDDMMMNDMDGDNNNNESFNRPTTLTATMARPPPAVALHVVRTYYEKQCDCLVTLLVLVMRPSPLRIFLACSEHWSISCDCDHMNACHGKHDCQHSGRWPIWPVIVKICK
jgi:hypothetical protein